jgi:DtxR family transcriptional regulator, Mn-dependent transcriptional regulator
MFPSSTVENYIKVIHAQQVRLSDPDGLVPMGHLAMGMCVTPGTATTMVKALADSGLVHYAPYAGVRLTRAGERLAGMVIRRHRLIELFLVQVMGLKWDEVHDEAEQLEHVVSERLIQRMDEMLGRPEVDPHGDPIPDAHGTFPQRELHSLLTCPLQVPVTVMRVADQDASFLRFVESHQLKPGQQLSVDARDEVADSVSVRAAGGEPLTIGARAASKLLVEVIAIVLFVLGLSGSSSAQTPAPAPAATEGTDSSRPFEIEDNSFFVEEAFNQEPGVVQTIYGGAFLQDSGWGVAFTQEWPAPDMRHQLSFTIPFSGVDGQDGIGDIALNYRYQLLEEGPGQPAMAPRLSLLVPSGDQSRGLGVSGWGLQVNLPVSKQFRDFYFHGNAGFSWRPKAESDIFPSASLIRPPDVTLFSPLVGGSAIYRLRPMLNLMMESVFLWQDDVVAPGQSRRDLSSIVSPGLRGGWNHGDQQFIVGAAVPFVWSNDATDVGIFTYFSFEGPFWKPK